MKQREQAMLFLRKAAEDEALVDEVGKSKRISDNIIGFHCQQAAEKLLKAVLSGLAVAFRRTHDLRELMDILSDEGRPLPEDLADLDTLTPYATLLRYEGIPADVSLDRTRARDMVRRLRNWAEEQVEGLK